ncbi:MAG TPA: hypothetical protein PKD26_10840 [Pyrinomonadaceae bacterium]|nr:hypothetical protein [Pyrinomonadaceae bacterium]
MRIKEILIARLKSPLANLLAIANLSMMAIILSFRPVRSSTFVELIYGLNMPALITSHILPPFIHPDVSIPPLIYLQWIAIVAFAKFVAYHAGSSADRGCDPN